MRALSIVCAAGLMATASAIADDSDAEKRAAKQFCSEAWPSEPWRKTKCFKDEVDAIYWRIDFRRRYAGNSPEVRVLRACEAKWTKPTGEPTSTFFHVSIIRYCTLSQLHTKRKLTAEAR